MATTRNLTLQRTRWTPLLDSLCFGLKQANACLFGGLLLALILGTHFYYPLDAIYRYDFLFIAAVAIQVVLVATRLEHGREVAIIALFHAVATVMELYKTHPDIGSWTYREDALLRIATVPLFTGFMYSAVGSYIARAWRLFDLRFSRFPAPRQTLPFVLAVYMNFFTHHHTVALHWPLVAWSLVLFGPVRVYFTPLRRSYSMPLVAGLLLVAVFIYIAENVGTFAGAWTYPGGEDGWRPVAFGKLVSWYLLMQISFVLVAVIQRAHRHAPAVRQADAGRN